MEKIVPRALAVIDDFLSPQEHLDLWEAFRATALSPADPGEWNRVYQLTDGDVPVSSASRNPSLQDASPGGGSPLLRVLGSKLCALMTGNPPIAIEPWTGFTLSAWTYSAGTGLEWHSDTGWLGAFVYYVHPAWRSSWGGELLVADDGSLSAAADPENSRSRVETVCRTGGAFVYPEPNRLVLLRGGTLHCIRKVESAAAFRASLSGFFFNSALG